MVDVGACASLACRGLVVGLVIASWQLVWLLRRLSACVAAVCVFLHAFCSDLLLLLILPGATIRN